MKPLRGYHYSCTFQFACVKTAENPVLCRNSPGWLPWNHAEFGKNTTVVLQPVQVIPEAQALSTPAFPLI
jgi:hypothetical protein